MESKHYSYYLELARVSGIEDDAKMRVWAQGYAAGFSDGYGKSRVDVVEEESERYDVPSFLRKQQQ